MNNGKLKLQKLLEERAARLAATNSQPSQQPNLAPKVELIKPATSGNPINPANPANPATPKATIEYNTEQLRAIELAEAGKPFCLIGAAGTGKTTTVKEIANRLAAGNLPKIKNPTKYLKEGAPPLALVSYTNRAVKNLAKACTNLKDNCITIHKLLEFGPVWYDVPDASTMSGTRKTMRFEPTYTATNPITELRLVVVDESSMCDTRLFKQLLDACPNATFVFLGDLNQLPPVFGDAILGYKLNELEVVELKQVYRQAMESPIIAFQHNFTLRGIIPGQTELEKISAEGKGLTFHFERKKETDEGILCKSYAHWLFNSQYKGGFWNPDEDIILIPFNKGFGTGGLNRELAQFFGEDRGAEVWHIISGMENHYYAVGDRVVANKEEWEIKEIFINRDYVGKLPDPSSKYLNRKGRYKLGHEPAGLAAFAQDMDLEQMLEAFDKEGAKQQASHCIVLSSLEHDAEIILQTTGEINAMTFGYATTIHKSQGSEWRKVYLICTNYHSTMLSRELLYTGMTRAKEELYVICSPCTGIARKDGSLQRGLKKQRIPGIGWKEKAEAFKGKQQEFNAFMKS